MHFNAAYYQNRHREANFRFYGLIGSIYIKDIEHKRIEYEAMLFTHCDIDVREADATRDQVAPFMFRYYVYRYLL